MTLSGRFADLEYDLAGPETPVDGSTVVLLLHGRGSHKGDLQALGPVLPTDWTLITPQAPFPGEEWGYGPGWAWYRYLGEDRVDESTLTHSLEMLDGFLAGVSGVVGFTPGRIVLGGFSQGGTMSLTYGLTRPGAVAAAFNFSGFLPDSIDPVAMSNGGDGAGAGAAGAAAVDGTAADAAPGILPIFWGHGSRDANVPFYLAERGRERLESVGAPLVFRDYPIGHWMLPDEVHEAVAMVEAAG